MARRIAIVIILAIAVIAILGVVRRPGRATAQVETARVAVRDNH